MASQTSFNINPSQPRLKTRARASGGSQYRRSTINILVIGSVFALGYLMGRGEIEGKYRLNDISKEDALLWLEPRHREPEITIPFAGMSMNDIRNKLDCRARKHDVTKPLQSLDDWNFLRENMREHLDSATAFNDPIPPTLGYSFLDTGGPPPFEARHSKGKGRGIFATRDIKKGELVHDGIYGDVMFKDGDSFRKYIWSLLKSKHTHDACDVLYWVDTMIVKGKLRLFVCPNIASYMNASGRHPNVLPKHHMSPKMWATTDIKKGEEILTDYSAYPTDWAAVGL